MSEAPIFKFKLGMNAQKSNDDARWRSRYVPVGWLGPDAQPAICGLLVGVVLIMGGLTYFPALSLGPVAEQVAMNRAIHYPAP